MVATPIPRANVPCDQGSRPRSLENARARLAGAPPRLDLATRPRLLSVTYSRPILRRLSDIGPGRVRADVCIIGAGAAGLTLAAELDGSPLRTIVLEGGGKRHDKRAQALYRSDVVGLAHGGIHELRFRVFGGTTTRWAGQALPLSDIDFTAREWVPGSGWPFGRDAIEGHYRRASALMQIPAFPRHLERNWPATLPP